MYTMFHLVLGALVVISTFHTVIAIFTIHVTGLKIWSINMTNFRALRANLRIYTQYFTISPCFRRPFYHFYTTYLPSLQMLRAMQICFDHLNKLIHFCALLAHWLGCSQYLTVWPCFRRALRKFDHFYTSVLRPLYILRRAFRQCFDINCKMASNFETFVWGDMQNYYSRQLSEAFSSVFQHTQVITCG